MKVLLIEDFEPKARQIFDFVRDRFAGFERQLRGSYTSGLKALREGGFDLILLDMSLPNFDLNGRAAEGGKFRSYGGRDLLHQLQRFNIATKVIVITQYGSFSDTTRTISLTDLSRELAEEFPQNYVTTIYYNSSDDAWKTELEHAILGVGL